MEEKQKFLREEIIDKGFDTTLFTDYVQGIKGEEGLDITQWSMDELKSLVKSFKENSCKGPEIDEESQKKFGGNEEDGKEYEAQIVDETQEKEVSPQVSVNSNQQQQHQSNNKNEIEQITRKISSDLGKDFLQDYQCTINCNKIPENEFTNRNDLFIRIKDPKYIKDGLFKLSKYCQYTVVIEPMNTTVVRRLSDFEFLEKIIPTYNPGIFNPLLPHSSMGCSDNSDKKMLYLEFFINSIVSQPFLRSLPVIHDFLTLKQEEWNKVRANNYQKRKECKGLKEMYNLDGIFTLIINKDLDNQALKIKEILTKKIDAYGKFNAAMDNLLINLDKMNESLYKVADTLSELKKVYSVDENGIISNGFEKLEEIFKLWSVDYLEQKVILRDDFKYFFKYIEKENSSYIKNFDVFNSSRNDYKKAFEKTKKLNGNIPETEKRTLSELKQLYAFNLVYINNEYLSLSRNHCERVQTQFGKYSNNKNKIFADYKHIMQLLLTSKDNELVNQILNNNPIP